MLNGDLVTGFFSISIFIPLDIHIHIYVRTYAHCTVRTYVCTYVYTYVHTYIKKTIFARTYVCTYMHTTMKKQCTHAKNCKLFNLNCTHSRKTPLAGEIVHSCKEFHLRKHNFRPTLHQMVYDYAYVLM